MVGPAEHIGQLNQRSARWIEGIYIEYPRPVGAEVDPSVGRPVWIPVLCRVACEQLEPAPVGVHHGQVRLPVAVELKGDAASVGRPDRPGDLGVVRKIEEPSYGLVRTAQRPYSQSMSPIIGVDKDDGAPVRRPVRIHGSELAGEPLHGEVLQGPVRGALESRDHQVVPVVAVQAPLLAVPLLQRLSGEDHPIAIRGEGEVAVLGVPDLDGAVLDGPCLVPPEELARVLGQHIFGHR